MLFPTFRAIAVKVKSLFQDRKALAKQDELDFKIRTAALINALYECGIPHWIAKRNAHAFMCLRPDFDLYDPKFFRIKNLLEMHKTEFMNAYLNVGRNQGKEAADSWLRWIRDNDIFWARIAQLPQDFETRYLFGG